VVAPDEREHEHHEQASHRALDQDHAE
jgi:hypothetical protein